MNDIVETTANASSRERLRPRPALLSPVVERPDRRVPFVRRVAAFLRRPRFRGHLLSAVTTLAWEWWIAQIADLREWRTPGSRLLNKWTGADSLLRASSVAIYVHYAPGDRVSDMVLRQVKEYRSQGFTVIFVSMCRSLDRNDVERLRGVTGLVLQRRNFALDFGAWQDVMPLLDNLAPDIRELLLVNDSVCGPLTSMFGVFGNIRGCGDGLFGLTENLVPRPHLQSYFLLARGRAAVADLMHFIGRMRLSSYKRAIIRRGEVRLSGWMRRRGHLVASPNGYEGVEWLALQRPRAMRRLGTIFPKAGRARTHSEWVEELRHFPVNPTHTFWYELVECCGFPFLKTEMLLRNPLGLTDVGDWRELLASVSSDELRDVIESHLWSMGKASAGRHSTANSMAHSSASRP
jgi:hypothetical protein